MAPKPKAPPNPDAIRLGKMLREARKRAEYTQEEAGKLFGITGQAVYQWEKGITTPDPKKVGLITDAYGLDSTEYLELVTGVQLSLSEAQRVPALFAEPIEEPAEADVDDLVMFSTSDVEGLRIEGEVAAGRWIEVHGDIDGELSYHDIYDSVPVAIDYRWPRKAQFGLIVRGTSINNIAIDGDVLTCVSLYETSYKPRDQDLVIVEQRRDAGLLIERTAKRWVELPERYELWPDSTDPRWQNPIIVEKEVGFDAENGDGISVSVRAFVTWVHRPLQVPVRRSR